MVGCGLGKMVNLSTGRVFNNICIASKDIYLLSGVHTRCVGSTPVGTRSHCVQSVRGGCELEHGRGGGRAARILQKKRRMLFVRQIEGKRVSKRLGELLN